MLAYRTSIQETTGATPYSVMFGREARLPIDLMFPSSEQRPVSKNQYVRQLKDQLQKTYQAVRKHGFVQQQRQKEAYDCRSNGNAYQVGDLVWLHSPAVPRGRSRKFHCPWQGPFAIKKVISSVTYRIQRVGPPQQRLVVHFNRLKPYQGSTREESPSPTPEPETTISEEVTNGGSEYLVPSPSASSTTQEPIEVPPETPPQVLQPLGDTSQPATVDNPPEASVQLRRSTRVTRPPNWYGVPVQFADDDTREVTTISQCVDTPPVEGESCSNQSNQLTMDWTQE